MNFEKRYEKLCRKIDKHINNDGPKDDAWCDRLVELVNQRIELWEKHYASSGG